MTDRPRRLALLRALCLLEALSLLALVLIAVPLKHLWQQPAPVGWVGPVHGLIFLAFCWRVVQALVLEDIPAVLGLRLLLASILPFGGFFSWRAVGRMAALSGN